MGLQGQVCDPGSAGVPPAEPRASAALRAGDPTFCISLAIIKTRAGASSDFLPPNAPSQA